MTKMDANQVCQNLSVILATIRKQPHPAEQHEAISETINEAIRLISTAQDGNG